MKKITKLQDGKKGVVFKIVTDDGKEEVIKFQKESPAKAILSASMLSTAGVNVPKISGVRGGQLPNLLVEVNNLLQTGGSKIGDRKAAELLADCLQKAGNPNSGYGFSNVVRMDFASGETLGSALKKGEDFKKMMLNPAFQKQLGKLIGADTFAGNGDRMFAMSNKKSVIEGMGWNETGSAPQLNGWFNPGNLVIEGSGKNIQIKAIDNDVSPGMNLSGDNVYGNWSNYAQYGSMAAADPALFKREIFAIAERMEKEAKIKLSPQELKNFIENATNSATETIKHMLEHGPTSKQVENELRQNGETEEQIKFVTASFEQHLQAMKVLAGKLRPDEVKEGVNQKPTVAMAMRIGRWNLSDDEAKMMMGMNKEQIQRFDKLMLPTRSDLAKGEAFVLTPKQAMALAQNPESLERLKVVMNDLVAGEKCSVDDAFKCATDPQAFERLKALMNDEKGLGLTGKEALGLAETEETMAIINNKTQFERFRNLMDGKMGEAAKKANFKISVKEATLLAKDESTYRQFTGQKGPKL